MSRYYGDVFTDDDGMSAFIRDRKARYEMSCAYRKIVKTAKKMSRKEFEKWLEKTRQIDDDKPLRAYL